MIAAGQLNQLGQLQLSHATRSATGNSEKIWITYATVWAAFRTLSGGERLAASQVGATLSHEITIRYDPSVKVLASHRFVLGDRVFDIKDVRNVDERNEVIRMICMERTV